LVSIFSDWHATDYFAAVVSVFVVSAGAAVVSAGAVMVVSAVDSELELPPPQAINAIAKPHTINNAITFFIVYRF
jgi:hypothetical protein